MEKIYLNKNDYKINKSFIMVAPTGTGKTQALIEYLKETNEHCIFVSPLNSIGKQVYEKSKGFFRLINCENKIDSIIGDIHYSLMNNESIIISLTTFIKYKAMFYKYNIYIDECHLLTDYKEFLNTDGLASDIRQGKFKKIVGLTATSFGLPQLLNLEEIKPLVKPKSTKHITLNWMNKFGLENLVGVILELYKQHKKLVVLLNNTFVLQQIQNELLARNLIAKLYTSENKEIEIINEHFSENFHILLCTSALTTGVSIRDDYYSVYIPQSFDSINTVPQFFSRNRNTNSYGCILKRFYSGLDIDTEIIEHEYYNKTNINELLIDKINNILKRMARYLTKNSLNSFVNTSNDYIFEYGIKYEIEIKLKTEQKFIRVIENQKQYFIENEFPKFDKRNYNRLYKAYQIFDIIIYGIEEEDNIITRYANKYIEEHDCFILDRGEFYDYCFKKIKEYKTDKGIELAKETNSNSLNIQKFEELFLNKPYKKKELKNTCVKLFAIKEEIFKNEKTIEQFLNKLGYILKYADKGKIIRRVQK